MTLSFLVCAFIIFVNLMRGSNVLLGQVVASRKIHGAMLRAVLEAPLTTYFDVTPIGRILNRFSKDMNTLDEGIGWTIDSVNKAFWLLMYSLIVAMLTVWHTALLLPVIFCWAYCIIRRCAAAIKETSRLEATTKSPVLSHFQESLAGGPTIRAFKRKDEFIQKLYALNNANI
jgi:ATP-binding cassette, subfamily C (CFTR/MRP), member 1